MYICVYAFTVGQRHGITVKDPLDVVDVNTRRSEMQITNDIRNIFQKFNTVNLVVGVAGDKDFTYRILKTQGDLHFGIPTQIVLSKNVFKLSDQLISNLFLKINTKLGGRNFVLSQTNNLYDYFPNFIKCILAIS